MSLRTPAFTRFVAPAEEKPALWRLVLTVLLALGLWVGIVGGVLAALAFGLGPDVIDGLMGEDAIGTHPASAAALLALFLPAWPAIALAMAAVQRRRFVTLFGPQGFRWRHFAQGMVPAAVFGAIAAVLAWSTVGLDPNLAFAQWLVWLPLILVLIFFQAGAEELLFRGLVMQGLAARFASPLIWFFLPQIVFGLGHQSDDLAGLVWLPVMATAIIGMVLADITRRTGHLAHAMGLHFGNNVLAILLIGYEGPLSGASLFLNETDLSDPVAITVGVVSSMVLMIVIYAVWLRFMPGIRGGSAARGV